MKNLPLFDKKKHKLTIYLTDEMYFEGQRVSHVKDCNANQLLLALKGEPGYYKVDRKSEEHSISHIEDLTGIEGN